MRSHCHAGYRRRLMAGSALARLAAGALAALGGLPFLAPTPALAQTNTLNNGSPNPGGGAWSVGQWSLGHAPLTGEDVVLNASNPMPNNYLVGVTLHSITLNPSSSAQSYTIGGNVIALQSGGFITDSNNTTGPDAINTGVTLNGAATITLSAGATGLSFGGAITGSGPLTFVNNSTGALTLAEANTYSGGTIVTAGTLSFAHTTGGNVVDTFGSGAVTLDGGTLRNATGGTPSLTNNIVLGAGGGTIHDGGSGIFLDGTITGAGSLTFAGPISDCRARRHTPGRPLSVPARRCSFSTIRHWQPTRRRSGSRAAPCSICPATMPPSARWPTWPAPAVS